MLTISSSMSSAGQPTDERPAGARCWPGIAPCAAPYPLRRARRRHRFPRADRHGARGPPDGSRPRGRPGGAVGAAARRHQLGPAGRAARPAGAGRRRRRRQPGRRRASATSAGPTTTSGRSARAGPVATTLLSEAIAAVDGGPRRAAVGLGHRLLRRPRRRGARRGVPVGRQGSWPSVLREWEASTAAAEQAGRPGGAPAHRDRAVAAGRRAQGCCRCSSSGSAAASGRAASG